MSRTIILNPYRIVREPKGGVISRRFEIEGIECCTFVDSDNGRETTRILEPESPVKLKHVILTRHEGLSYECNRPMVLEGEWREPCNIMPERWWCTPIIQANSELMWWGRSAPKSYHEGGPGGYDKCGFVVEWVDGTKYEGRFDLQYGGTDSGQTFVDSFRGRIHVYSGLAPCPYHMKEDEFQRVIMAEASEGFRKTCRHILSQCEL